MQIRERLKYRDEFTDELMRHEGLAGSISPPLCEMCLEPGAIYHCLDCFSKCMLCQHCIVTAHGWDPLHNIQVRYLFLFSSLSYLTDFQKWTGNFFTRITLFDLSATYQLGHHAGESCAMPSPTIDLTLFNISSVTVVHIHYCYCGELGQQQLPCVQLLCIQWFPATLEQPGTAFTFHLLDFLHKLQT